MRFFEDSKERYFINGLIYEDGKLAGYNIYAANQKKVLGIITREEAFKAKEAGLNVVGLNRSKSGTISEMRNSYFNINKLDEVNGKGHPIKLLGNYILNSFSGFSEDRKYRLVNSRGYERIANQKEFETLVDEGKVNGAIRAPRNKHTITRYKHCDYREGEFE